MSTEMDEDPSWITLGRLVELPQTTRLIGEFVVRWSLAETTLMLPLSVAMETNDQQTLMACLASTNSTEGKIKMVMTALKAGEDRLGCRDAILKELGAFMRLCEVRNALMHHLWGFRRNTASAVTIDYRKRIGSEGRVVERSEEDILELCNEVVRLAGRISEASGSNFLSAQGVELLLLEAEYVDDNELIGEVIEPPNT